VNGWPWLIGTDHHAGMVVIHNYRPKVAGRNIGRQMQFVIPATVQRIAIGVDLCNILYFFFHKLGISG